MKPYYLTKTSCENPAHRCYCVLFEFTENTVNQFFSTTSAPFTFSAKEKDQETGFSYFGSRYYNSDLSIWLSVDPQASKYPSSSPYVYCANNPIKLVDPNGEDWFENELTGDVYYCRDYRKGDEKELKGEGWKWMGENNMFGQSADDAITANLDKADVYTQGDSYDRVGFSGNNAKEFMSNMGYKEVPTQIIEYEKSNVQRTWTPAGSLSVDIGGIFQIAEKKSYVKKEFDIKGRQQIGNSLHSTQNGCAETVSRVNLSYGNTHAKLGSFCNTVFGGSVDLKRSGPCVPNMKLINEFLNGNK